MEYNAKLSKCLGDKYHLNRFLDKKEAIKHLYPFDFTNVSKEINKGGVPLYTDGIKGYVDNSEDHTLIIGATASMKSIGVIMPTIISLGLSGENMVVLDPKGEICEKTSGLLKNLNYEVKILNFRDLAHSDSYNPLFEPYKLLWSKPEIIENKNKAKELINDISTTIASQNNVEESKQDPYWVNSATEFIDGAMNLLINLTHENTCNFTNLASLVNAACYSEDEDENHGSLKHFISSFPDSYSIKQKMHGTLFNANTTRNCIISEVKNLLSCFTMNRELEDVLSNNTINLRDFANEEKKVALFIIVPDEKSNYNTISAIIIKQLYSIAIDEANKRKGKKLYRRLNFILDEFANIPKIPDMNNMISAARSRNIRFYLVLQCNSQLEAKYGEHHASTIKNNCQNWIFLNTRESKVIDEIIHLLGEDPSNPSKHELMSPVDLLAIKKHYPYVRALVINQNGRPFVTDLLDASKYQIMQSFAPVVIKTKKNVKDYIDVSSLLIGHVHDLESRNRLLINDGLAPNEYIEEEINENNDEDFILPFEEN